MDKIEMVPLEPGPSALAWLRVVAFSAVLAIACFVVLSVVAGAHSAAWSKALSVVLGISAVVFAAAVLCTLARLNVERRSDYTTLPFLGRDVDCVDPRTGAILREGGEPPLPFGQYLAARAAARARTPD